MKKIVCLILSLLFIVGIVPINVSGTVPANMSIDEFSKQVCQMITEYDVVKNSQETLSVQSFSADSEGNYSEFETMRLIVKSKSKINTLDAVSVISGYKDLWVLQFETEYYTAEAFEYYSALECVEYVEPDSIITMDTVVETFSAERLENGHLSWGSEAIGSVEVLDYLETVSVDLVEVKVGVIDSGIDYNHEFLKDRMIDEGLNFSASGDDTAMSDDPDSHGTHVSGIIVDNTPESVKIKGYKIFDSEGETTALAIVSAVDKAVSDGMDILNLSFSGGTSETVKESFLNAYQNGIALISAAGNDSLNIDNILPSCLKESITVAAMNPDFTRAKFSDYGDSVDLAAPGVEIYSTYNNDSYGYMDGTSMATPFVSACAAILLSLNPTLSPEDIETQLKSNAIPIGSTEIYVGSGLVNISEALDINRVNPALSDNNGGVFYNPVTITLSENPETKTYYTLDGSLPDSENGILYTSSIEISQSCVLSWCTYSDDTSLFRSNIQIVEFSVLTKASDSEFKITEEGVLIAYNGTDKEIVVPASINGIAVTEIGVRAFDANNAPEIVGIVLPKSTLIINSKAFNNNTSLEYIKAPNVETISSYAFQECFSLKRVDAPNVKKIERNAFEYCTVLSEINFDNVEEIAQKAFYGNKGLSEIKFDKLQKIGEKAFGNTALIIASFSTLKTFKDMNRQYSSEAFYDCLFLSELYFPELTSLGTVTNNSRAFRGLYSLTTFYAPKLEEIPAQTFYNCISLKNVTIDSAHTIKDEAFYGCEELKYLYLPNVKYVGEDVFRYSAVENIFFGALEETYSIPVVDSIIAIPSTATIIEENHGGAHLKIYGTKGTYAEEWANSEHKYCTSEFISLPLITDDLPLEISENEGKLTIDAIGFNLSYQWYGSVDGTTENSVILEGEDKEDLLLENTEKYKGYYCIVSGEDGEFITSVTSNVVIVNYNFADYTEYKAAIASIPAILSIYTEESVEKLQNVLSIDVSNKLSYEQNVVDEQTQAILNAVSALELRSADYSELDKVLETVPVDLSIYTDESLMELNDVLDSIDENLDITNQSQIDEWARQVETAVKNLKIKPADYTALDEAISKIPDNLSFYTDESVAELEKVLNSIDRELDVTQQEQVDNYVTAVEQAITNLNYKSADYSLVFDAIATIPEDLSIYTPESVDALESIIDGIDYSLDITQQEKVDEYAVQIRQAVDNLEEECWLVRLLRVIISFFKDIILCLENYMINIFYC